MCYDDEGNLLAEGTEITAKLEREGTEIDVKFPLKHGTGKRKHHFDVADELSKEQQSARSTWLGK